MKKYFFFAACASVAFASCVNDVPDAPVNDEQHAITFDVPVVQPNSRTQTEVGTAYENGGDFKVSAWYFKDGTYENGSGKGQLFMENIEVTNINGTYKNNSNTYYYPKNGSLTFIAYSPAGLENVTVNKTTGITISEFTADGDGTDTNEQDDILFSERTYNKESGQVDILFNHALSSIRFSALTAGDYENLATVTIKSIELVNVFSQGVFNQNLQDDNEKYTKTPVRMARYGITEGSNEKLTPEQEKMLENLSTEEAKWPSSNLEIPKTYKIATFNSNNSVNLTKSSYSPSNWNNRETDFLFIPQAFTNDQKLVVTYDVDVIATTGGEADFKDQKYEKTFAAIHMSSDGWLMGYRYTYNIKISLDEITFKPSVEAFLDVPELIP